MKSKVDIKKTSNSYDCGLYVTQSTALADVEIYKRISEDNSTSVIAINNGVENKIHLSKDLQILTAAEQKTNTVAAEMAQVNTINDGADEQMLHGVEDNDKLAIKRDEVKFIKSDHQNGDAKIDIGVSSGAQFTGMTKEELMKYANDPFWIRLRWIFFVAFWLMWLSMLGGAIFIIIDAPKCSAPEPLPWYKRGLMAKFNKFTSANMATHDDVIKAQEMAIDGVIYELPPEETYSLLDQPEIEENIKNLVNQYKHTGINVILDITPNYVPRKSRLMQDALVNEAKRSPFIWKESTDTPNNWVALVGGSAWSVISAGNYVLSQFGEGLYDLHMNDTIVKRDFSLVLRRLIELGVKGIRLKNSKFYILHKSYDNEEPAGENTDYDLSQYGFWTHTHSTFQNGLGDVLQDYMALVKNISNDVLFTVAEDIIRPDIYRTYTGEMGIDIPMYGRLIHSMSVPNGRHLSKELLTIMTEIRGLLPQWVWLQWNLEDIDNKTLIHRTAIELFTSLLPGIPVIPITTTSVISTATAVFTENNINMFLYKHINQLRTSPSFMHGDFKIFSADPLLAYARIKSGNPGYFIVFNPTDLGHKHNFTALGLPEKMTIDSQSNSFVNNSANISSKVNIFTDELEIPPMSTVVLSYVPVKTD